MSVYLIISRVDTLHILWKYVLLNMYFASSFIAWNLFMLTSDMILLEKKCGNTSLVLQPLCDKSCSEHDRGLEWRNALYVCYLPVKNSNRNVYLSVSDFKNFTGARAEFWGSPILHKVLYWYAKDIMHVQILQLKKIIHLIIPCTLHGDCMVPDVWSYIFNIVSWMRMYKDRP